MIVRFFSPASGLPYINKIFGFWNIFFKCLCHLQHVKLVCIFVHLTFDVIMLLLEQRGWTASHCKRNSVKTSALSACPHIILFLLTGTDWVAYDQTVLKIEVHGAPCRFQVTCGCTLNDDLPACADCRWIVPLAVSPELSLSVLF